jgi:hypothetical protein
LWKEKKISGVHILRKKNVGPNLDITIPKLQMSFIALQIWIIPDVMPDRWKCGNGIFEICQANNIFYINK